MFPGIAKLDNLTEKKNTLKQEYSFLKFAMDILYKTYKNYRIYMDKKMK